MARGPREKFEHAELGKAFKWMRARSGFTQRDLAEEVVSRGHSISSEYYSECERSVKYPSKHKAGVIVETLGYSLDDLETLLEKRPWAESESRRHETSRADFALEAEEPTPPPASNFLAASDPAGSFSDQVPGEHLVLDQLYSLERQASKTPDLSPFTSENLSSPPPSASGPPPIKSRAARSSTREMLRQRAPLATTGSPAPSLPEPAPQPAAEGTLGEELAEVVRLYADASRGDRLNVLALLRNIGGHRDDSKA